MKILILLLYYDRPEMVKNALKSIKNVDYTDWHLAFIDDGSSKPGRPVVEEILANYLDKITFYNTEQTTADKTRHGGIVGETMNKAIKDSDAEMAIMLCDDDALISSYFSKLNQWAISYPDRHYCYSHVILYNPFKEQPQENASKYIFRDINGKMHKFNRYKSWYNKTQKVYPEASLDASQVAWRTYCNQKAHFPSARTCHLDSGFYKKLGEHYGQVMFSGFYGQYKGIHDYTLSIREEAFRHNITKNSIFIIKDLDND